MSNHGHVLRLHYGNGWDARPEILTGWCACVRDPLCWWDRHLESSATYPDSAERAHSRIAFAALPNHGSAIATAP